MINIIKHLPKIGLASCVLTIMIVYLLINLVKVAITSERDNTVKSSKQSGCNSGKTSYSKLDCPIIASISYKLLRKKGQPMIKIRGKSFGTMNPYNSNSKFIRIRIIDLNTCNEWHAGSNRTLPISDFVTLNITSWKDTEIIVHDFTGSYGDWGWEIKNKNIIQIQVWNAQNLEKVSNVCSITAEENGFSKCLPLS